MVNKFLSSPRWFKRAASVAYDLLAIYLSFVSAWALRIGNMDYDYSGNDLLALAVAATASIVVFVRLGLYRAVLRYVTHQAFVTIALGVFLSALVLAATSFMLGGKMPRSVPMIYASIAFISIGAPRILFRSLIHWLNPGSKEPVLIYGAGDNGSHLAAALQMGSEYHPVAFIDDDKHLQKTSIRGLHVYPPKHIAKLVERYNPTTLLLAIGQHSKEELARILKICAPCGLRIATIPRMGELISGESQTAQLRDIKITDVLGREPVDPIPELLKKNVTGKTVLVTGAGGSIGSELCRQVLELSPERLILFDNSEYGLYKLNEELTANFTNAPIQIVLGDIRNEKSISDTIAKYRPLSIYHAAAYKHVPMVEQNTWEGIRNNSYGTLVVGRAAIKYKVQSFVLISTDKAVRPTNVMGATKRLAEIVIQALQQSPDNDCTCFSAVRFGNVLDSSGSVVPKFREQIAAGGPVTVTHPEVTRYFMTLQEAAQLVIQASALSSAGSIYVLDMGEPVKILDVAKEMIALSFNNQNLTRTPPEIKFVGLRPGEKLYEELLLTNQCSGTQHPRIWLDLAANNINELAGQVIEELECAIQTKDIPALEKLVLSSITEYKNTNYDTGVNKAIEETRNANIIPLSNHR